MADSKDRSVGGIKKYIRRSSHGSQGSKTHAVAQIVLTRTSFWPQGSKQTFLNFFHTYGSSDPFEHSTKPSEFSMLSHVRLFRPVQIFHQAFRVFDVAEDIQVLQTFFAQGSPRINPHAEQPRSAMA